MKVWVFLTAFLTSEFCRPVEVEDGLEGEDLLDAVFKFGQNDFQPKPYPSVSVRDLILLPNGEWHIVDPIGFRQLTDKEAMRHMRKEDRRNQESEAHYKILHGDEHTACWEADREEAWASLTPSKRTNDPHILALAQVEVEEVYQEELV